MRLLTGTILLLRDMLVALWHLAAGQRRRRYETSIFIAAPPDIVWQMLRSRDITFESFFGMRIIREPLHDGSGLERNTVRIGQSELVVMLRLIEERPLVALQYELVGEASAPELVSGREDFTTYVLHAHRGGTQLDLSRELVPTRRLASILVPMGLRSGAWRYKSQAERMAAEQEQHG